MTATLLKTLALATCAAGLVTLAGCTERTHLTESYARGYRTAFSRQQQNPTAGQSPHATASLDTQDAAMIAKTYRRSMAPRGESSGPEQPLVVVQPTKPNQGYMPPPSVPQ